MNHDDGQVYHVGQRVHWFSPAEDAMGTVVRVEGNDHVWVQWDSNPLSQRLMLPQPWMMPTEMDDDDY